MKYICPVCGDDNLYKPAYDQGIGSYEICLCCGFQYEVTDEDRGYTFAQWRAKWIKEGMQWNEGDSEPPVGWNPRRQLLNVIPASEIPK